MKKILLCILFLLAFLGSQAVIKPISKISQRFVSTHQYDSLIAASVITILSENYLPPSVCKNRFETNKTELTKAMLPILKREFYLVEYYNETGINAARGSRPYHSVKLQYQKSFYKAARQLIYNTVQWKKLFNFNLSDRILNFASIVNIEKDGKLFVKETIKIFNGDGNSNFKYDDSGNEQDETNTNNEIKRGIVRTFPTEYRSKFGFYKNTSFKVISVLKDGKPEPWFIKKHQNGYQLYIGKVDESLEAGLYIYEIEYQTNHQLLIANDYDECYWNATGNGWSFCIEESACTINLPKGAKYISEACYTGLSDSKKKDCVSYFDNNTNSITFKSLSLLKPNEGLTVAVSWPKGFIDKPTFFTKIQNFITANFIIFIFPFAILFVLVLNTIFWIKVGRDKNNNTPYPLFEPPVGYSPAALGYIYNQNYDIHLTSASILDLAVNKSITIIVGKTDGLFKKETYQLISNTENELANSSYSDFFSQTGTLENTTLIKGEYNANLGSYNRKIQHYCEENYLQTKKTVKGLFSLNQKWLVTGNLIGLLATIYTFYELVKINPPNGWLFLYAAIGFLLFIRMQFWFYKIMPAYNDQGLKLMAQIEGFIMYLKAAEERPLNAGNVPKKTPQLFEKYLPFAVALKCDIEWANQFEKVLEAAQSQSDYNPHWYQSMNSSHWNAGIGSTLSKSLTGTISSASSPPSSGSSGSSGGGSSGGGGGGGGGGGW